MLIFSVLEELGDEALEWKKRLQRESEHYPWVDRINRFLGKLPDRQIPLLKKKFRNISRLDLLIDKLVEIFVGAEFERLNPSFLPDALGGPDIYLQDKREYVEVKRINNSNDEKVALGVLEKTGRYIGAYERPLISFEAEEEGRHQKLLSKTYEQIDKASQQLGNKPGFVYVVYSLDFLKTIGSYKLRSRRFEADVIKYCNRKSIELKVRELSALIAHLVGPQ